MTYALGIDVGTTFTAAAIWRDGRAEVVDLGERARTIPSVLFLRDDGVMLVGEAAERRAITDPSRVAREFKRRFGDDVPVRLADTWVGIPDLVADMIRFVVSKVTERESQAPGHVMLTRPATWSGHRQDLMEQAAGLAGLTDVGLLSEPVAAAGHYAAQDRLTPGDHVGVYDLGGGTFDATVLRKTDGGFEVCGEPGGDDDIGGIDIDEAVLDHIARTVGPPWQRQDLTDPETARAVAQVHAAAVAAKEALSADTEAEIPVIIPGCNRTVRLTRDDLEESVRIMVLRTLDTFRRTCRSAGVEPADLNRVLLVGGSSRIPLVARLVEREFRVLVTVDTHPKFAVCLGAAIAGGARLSRRAPQTPRVQRVQGAPQTPQLRTMARPAATPSDADVRGSTDTSPDTQATDRGTARSADSAAAALAADLLAPLPVPARPAVTVEVDLAQAGLDEPYDQLLHPPQVRTRDVRLTDRDEPLRIHLGPSDEGYRNQSRRVAAVGGLIALVVIAAILAAVFAATGHPSSSTSAPQSSGPGSTRSTGPAVGSSTVARLTAGLLTADAAPGSAVYGFTDNPRGGRVAVGNGSGNGSGGSDRGPAAWSSDGASAWTPAVVRSPAGSGPGVMTGVASIGGRLVAVGWTAPPGAGPSQAVPTAWLSPDGRTWQAVGGDLSGSPGQMSDVVAVPGGLLAVGVDRGTDRDGDVAVWRSTDGQTWRRETVTGAGGLGTQTLDRVVALPGGALLAVGQEPEGAGTSAHFRRSADGRGWQDVPTDLPPDAVVTVLALTSNGRLLAGGSILDTPGKRRPVIWLCDEQLRGCQQQDIIPAEQTPPTATPSIRMYTSSVTGATITAAGTSDASGDSRATVWTLVLDQPR
ncbi:Hsp70 family protein [Frankia sp. Cas4]|uniref:Hsp70 family protein n=1 Tax=Frankia sp. Cas4 TaxID=3073927 RepID=UPI002AD4892F|nr:Hsp70 family protein [Frankia sp. Cas4]